MTCHMLSRAISLLTYYMFSDVFRLFHALNEYVVPPGLSKCPAARHAGEQQENSPALVHEQEGTREHPMKYSEYTQEPSKRSGKPSEHVRNLDTVQQPRKENILNSPLGCKNSAPGGPP